jgi:hypothetical protein
VHVTLVQLSEEREQIEIFFIERHLDS